MKRESWKRFLAGMLCFCCIFLAACKGGEGQGQEKEKGKSLTGDVKTHAISVEHKENINATVAATDFGLRMFKSGLNPGENMMISPMSILFALGMTANGARENTLAQFEQAFGMSTEELNVYLYAYISSLPDEKNCKVKAANSIWLRDIKELSVSSDFLQVCADYYAADVYREAFDEATKNAVNNWVKKNTDGMIEGILDRIPEDAVMYLVNAMAFDAKWQEPYEESDVVEGEFTKEDGAVQNVDFMYSDEGLYLENENATGFLKYYEGGKYAFAALLPKEGVSVEKCALSLNGEELNDMLKHPTQITVYAAIPKFEAEYSAELGGILKDLGIGDAFDPAQADFTGLAESERGNIYISRVIHKTYISVDEKGTKAAAVTAVEMMDNGVAMVMPEYKVVHLDRPFIYFLIDCEEALPVFMGTVYAVK